MLDEANFVLLDMDYQSSTEEQSIENAVDSIEDFDELLTLLKVFNMKPSKEETFKMMQRKVKEKIKEQSSGKIAVNLHPMLFINSHLTFEPLKPSHFFYHFTCNRIRITRPN
jgi:molybdenum cofactor biosynthesis enzyme MoaA